MIASSAKKDNHLDPLFYSHFRSEQTPKLGGDYETCINRNSKVQIYDTISNEPKKGIVSFKTQSSEVKGKVCHTPTGV